MVSFNRYSHHARRALSHAGLLVNRYRHPFIDTGHLLVGVILTEGSIGWQVLHEMKLDAEHAQIHLQALYPMLDAPRHEAANSLSLETTLTLSADEANWLGHHYIGTAHLLLGITRTNAGNASALLRRLNTSSEQVRSRVRRALKDGATELDFHEAKRNARLSELSRRVINAAEQLAVALDHHTVGLGHLLLVLLLEVRSPTSNILHECGLDEQRLRQGLNKRDALLLVSIEVILSDAVDQTQRLGNHYTGTEHLLLTLAMDSIGSQILSACGVEADNLRRRLLADLR